MAKSCERYHLDQVLYLNSDEFKGSELGELIWMTSHENIAAFLEQIPPESTISCVFEDLVTNPQNELREMCSQSDSHTTTI